MLASDNGTCVFPSVFIPLDQLRNAVWYAILAFIIKEIWDIFKFRYIETRAEVKERINSVLHRRYDEFVKKYDYTVDRCIGEIYGGEDLDVKMFYQCMSSLLYAIMIYED